MNSVFAKIPQIDASLKVESYIRARGGSIFIWPSHHRCCGDRLTLLDTSTQRPPHRDFEEISCRGCRVFLDAALHDLPDSIELELRGLRRNRIVAYWNGCAFVI